jgi:hypothetical protein
MTLCVCYSTVTFVVCNSVRLLWHVKIRCQETDGGDYNRLRTLVGVTLNCKVWRLAVALYYL